MIPKWLQIACPYYVKQLLLTHLEYSLVRSDVVLLVNVLIHDRETAPQKSYGSLGQEGVSRSPRALNRIIQTHVMTSFLYLFFALLSIGSCKKDRYLTYTVNVGEGFNLRRDVHMRAAILVHNLRKSTEYNWILVLPPWPRLYHWKSPSQESWLPWRNFFDIDSLNEFVPSIEFDQYILKKGGSIDSVSNCLYLLQVKIFISSWIKYTI